MIWHLLIVYTLVPTGCKRQIAQRIVSIIGEFFGDLVGDHAVQFVVGVDMGALVGLIGLLIVLILGSGVFGLIRLIGVVRLVDVFAAVQARATLPPGLTMMPSSSSCWPGGTWPLPSPLPAIVASSLLLQLSGFSHKMWTMK